MLLPRGYALAILFLFSNAITGWGQLENKQIVKLTYTSSPISQYTMTESDMSSTPTKASIYEFMKGITDYYSLYINLEDRSSVYVLDSTVQVRPIGWENPKTRAALADTVLFTLKTPKNITFKHEWIMNQTFYTEGKVGDIGWELTNEEKTIDGLKCLKAVTEENGYPMLTVWYTKELPVSNGPSIYQGLPGLVVRAEDYFRTIQLLKIAYTDDVEGYRELYESKYEVFNKEKERKKHYEIEPILLIKKGDLAKGNYEYFHKKPYKRARPE
ncbi:GLPGLI family protein [Flagellimonas taeanensis]|uniref:GLPGLI family protein n=1 Tax=Flagellimonas taeanensis TaxID=1005926 RepID=A0A1M6SHL2_9FLAO|nr:GLPGLI family protein [Allomuricauda taeanensis]SFB80744.1 GLPGLI family protein [Allomuricauda taeanensis]SHK44008.1 GLPGLI family protein [Allomuricauda taeanensis]